MFVRLSGLAVPRRMDEVHMTTVLIIEDDPNIRLTMEFALADAGYSTMTCDNGSDGLAIASSSHPDLILLDLMLPVMDGKTFLRRFRRRDAFTPIIVVTALSLNEDKVACFDAGADDYISKPLSVDELLARIRANLRRSKLAPVADQRLEFGDMAIDLATQEVTVKGLPVQLRNREYELLAALARQAGSLVRREDLVKGVLGEAASADSRAIDVHVHNLRDAIESPSDYQFVTTEYGKGYRLQAVPKRSE